MLQKFLVIGVGGSGGKTVRIVRRDIELRLQEAGYTGPVPRGWQFLQLDVPVTADGNDPDLPDQLPAGDYLGLAARNLTYRDLDRVLDTKGAAVGAHTGGWRPDAREVNVPPAYGAGQYRAVGRVVAAAAMEQMVSRLKRAVRDLTLVDVNAELEAVSRQLGVPIAGSPLSPRVVVISSIAGGAGAGFVLDVCDALRMLGISEKWLGDSVGILYTPDVFDELPSANRSGVNPNALGALNELLAGYWNNDDPTPEEFALLEASGLATFRVPRRGPRYPFIVGKSNGRVTFTAQNDVYRAVGKSLAAWVLSARVQDVTNSFLVANWSAAANDIPDNLGISTGREAPLCSLGYSSISLGRDRFVRYASERLARDAVKRILRGHYNEKVPEEQHPDAARDEMANDALYAFLEDAGLRELGPDFNQIIDAIRGGERLKARTSSLNDLRRQIVKSLTSGKPALESRSLVQQISREMEDRKHKYLGDQQAGDRQRAEEWVGNIQDNVIRALSMRLGQMGADVCVRLIELTTAELKNSVIPEFNQDIEQLQRLVGTTNNRVQGKFANFEGQILPSNPLIEEAVKEGLNSLWAETEILMLELSKELISDFCDGYLAPLREAIRRGMQALSVEEEGSAGLESYILKWPEERVPESLEPAQNEVLLEPVGTYPAAFAEKVRQTCGTRDPGGAQVQAVRELVSGVREQDDVPKWILRLEDWVPKDSVIRIGVGARKAVFETSFGGKDLLHRASAWVREKDTAIGDFVKQTLRDYLDPKSTDPGEHEKRLNQFAAGFSTVLDTSAPLVRFDEAAMHRIHETGSPQLRYVMTVIPFPKGHPAREATTDLMLNRKMDSQEIEARFGDSEAQRVEVSTFLATPMQPVVFGSLMTPIMSDWAKRRNDDRGSFWRWRRARPLPSAIPAAHGTVMNMIRGWFVARLLNQIQSGSYRAESVKLFIPREGWSEFPFPYLGPPPTALDEVLPVILESLPLALFEAASQSLDQMKPYWRLCELGQMKDRNPAHSELHEEVLTWLREGRSVPDGPQPEPGDAGAVSDNHETRVQITTAFLDKFLSHYEDLLELPVTPEATLRFTRAWEMRREIVAALAHLREMTALEGKRDQESGIG